MDEQERTTTFLLYRKIKETAQEFAQECGKQDIPFDDIVLLGALRFAILETEEILRFKVKDNWGLWRQELNDDEKAEQAAALMKKAFKKFENDADFKEYLNKE